MRVSHGILEVHTFLTVIAPVSVVDLEVGFAEDCHEGYFPENGLCPRTSGCDLNLAFESIFRGGDKYYRYLFRLEAVSSEVIEIVF
jgi:hypothetical protein